MGGYRENKIYNNNNNIIRFTANIFGERIYNWQVFETIKTFFFFNLNSCGNNVPGEIGSVISAKNKTQPDCRPSIFNVGS